MEILQQFVVNGETFASLEEAQKYVDTNADIIRISAFVDHLKANGSKRISALVMDTIKGFIEFEKGQGTESGEVGTAGKSVDVDADQSATTSPTTLSEDSSKTEGTDEDGDEPPWSGDAGDDDTVVTTGEEQEVKVENIDVTTEVSGEVKGTEKASGLAGIVPTEKSRNLFAKA